MEILWKLFFSFLKVGTIGFGGGQATIPLIEAEVVDKHAWLTGEEFSDFYAIGNTLPGPIATKMSIIIGFDQAGILGAIVALIAMLLPSSIAIVVIYLAFMEFKDTKFVQGMQKAAKPVVAVLIGGVAYGMVRKLIGTFSSESVMNTVLLVGIFVVSLSLFLLSEYEILKVHPAIIVIGALLVGGFFIR